MASPAVQLTWPSTVMLMSPGLTVWVRTVQVGVRASPTCRRTGPHAESGGPRLGPKAWQRHAAQLSSKPQLRAAPGPGGAVLAPTMRTAPSRTAMTFSPYVGSSWPVGSPCLRSTRVPLQGHRQGHRATRDHPAVSYCKPQQGRQGELTHMVILAKPRKGLPG
jgi:hypothetical protein